MYFAYGEAEASYLRQKDKRLCQVIDRIGHIDRPVDTDLFSSVVHHIIGQQISTKAQATIWQRMQDALGTVTADSITLPAETPYEPSAEVIRLNNEISRMLDMAEIDKTVLRSKMTECFRQKYKELGNECCAVQRLKAEVGSTADIAERLNRAVSEIRLYTDKTADIILLNGQIIRKEQGHATDNGRPSESGAGNRTDRIGQRERENPLPSPAGGGILPRFH